MQPVKLHYYQEIKPQNALLKLETILILLSRTFPENGLPIPIGAK
jgi:hypothetical protein